GERTCAYDEVLDLMKSNDNHSDEHTSGECVELSVNDRTAIAWKEAGGMLLDQRFCPRTVEGESRYSRVADKPLDIIHKKPKEGGIFAAGGICSISTSRGRADTRLADLTDGVLSNGYMLEGPLSFDHLFVLHLIFKTCETPEHLKHRPPCLRICGAVLFRLVSIYIGDSLMHEMCFMHLVPGAFLICTGVKTIAIAHPLVQLLARKLPFVSACGDKGAFFVRVLVGEHVEVVCLEEPSGAAARPKQWRAAALNDGRPLLASPYGGFGKSSTRRRYDPTPPATSMISAGVSCQLIHRGHDEHGTFLKAQQQPVLIKKWQKGKELESTEKIIDVFKTLDSR
ncbi:unnamed protein product, partial [Prorocentrum cordatum]